MSDIFKKTPRELGFRMPAEWEPHEATWMSWPQPEGISFPGRYDQVVPTFLRMIEVLTDSEPVHLNVKSVEQEKQIQQALSAQARQAVRFFCFPTNEPWCRDHGPIFLTRQTDKEVALTDWRFNAWGEKYRPYDADDAIPRRIAQELGLVRFECPMVLEGGSIDVNGSGTLLTTESCLLNPNRNPNLSKDQIEQILKDYLGVSQILWLGEGIGGDDTDGHVDDLTRFVSRDTVLTVIEEDKTDANYDPLKANLERLKQMKLEEGDSLFIRALPMPQCMVREGQRLPASYANFYIANRCVLLPIFSDPKDTLAIEVLKEAFPDRTVVPLDSRELIWGLGAFHCLTQQQPSSSLILR